MKYNPNDIVSEELANRMMSDKKVRTSITKKSFLYFFHFYHAHYIKYPTAQFQKEIISHLEKDANENLFIVAFRGSGKSTIITSAYALWAMLGDQQKSFALILCQVGNQSRQHMMNLRQELEGNELLRNDLGPFHEEQDEWGSRSLVFSSLNARITVASSEQSIRGLRHGPHRPDLIIVDDAEDLASTKNLESRDKTHQWLTGEVIPAGDKNTRLIVVGNLLHQDSLLMRLKRSVEEKKLDGIFKEYPLVDADGRILWPGKYPTMEDIEKERRSIGNTISFEREYMLRILPADDQVIYRDWIHYYDVMPPKNKCESVRIGVDLAISEKNTADYTAFVIGWVHQNYDTGENTIYIDQIINKRMQFPDTLETCRQLHQSLKSLCRPDFVIEDVAMQRSLPQMLEGYGISAKGFKIGSQDKRSRLSIASQWIKSGRVLFPRQGCEKLIDQMVNFGTERFDDLADAFTILLLDVIDNPPVCLGVM